MAAFSSIFQQQQQPFLLDPNSHPNSTTTNNNVCALLQQPKNPNFISTSFYHIIHPQNLDHNNNNNNTIDSSSSSGRLLSPTNNKNTTMDSSSIVTHHHHHHNLVTTPMDKKRKNISKDIKSEVKVGKKQKKMKDNNISEEQNKSSKEEEEAKKAAAGYIHVRARRGQATDSHSLAERVRRERISERMKLLQGLVPGCDKVTGKALMLDEIINYVQSLQNQVEFLSMKLASANPMFYDFGVDLESFMVRPYDQDLSNLASPLPSMQESSPTTANNYHNLLENPANSTLFPHTQIPNALPQLGSRQGLWEVDEHRQRIMNQSELFTNAFFSFH